MILFWQGGVQAHLTSLVSSNRNISEVDFSISLLYPLHISLEKFNNLFFSYSFEYIGSTSGEEGVDHRKTRILCGGSYECDDSFFYPWEEYVLLRFRPSMYLIEKEYRLSTIMKILLCLADYLDDIVFFGEDS